MIDERAEILIVVCSLFLVVATVVVTRHLRHILKMTLASFFADWTVMRMTNHEALDNIGPARLGSIGLKRDDHPVGGGRHTRHH